MAFQVILIDYHIDVDYHKNLCYSEAVKMEVTVKILTVSMVFQQNMNNMPDLNDFSKKTILVLSCIQFYNFNDNLTPKTLKRP